MIIQIIGWLGTILIVLAYYLSTEEKIKLNGLLHFQLNFWGAFFVGLLVFKQEAWPALALQIVWLVISIRSYFKGKEDIEQTMWNP